MLLYIFKAGLVSAFIDVGDRLGSDVVQLVSVVRQIAIKACVVFSAGLLVSVAAFIALRRLEPPDVTVIVASATAREGSPGPRPVQRRDMAVTSTVTSLPPGRALLDRGRSSGAARPSPAPSRRRASTAQATTELPAP